MLMSHPAKAAGRVSPSEARCGKRGERLASAFAAAADDAEGRSTNSIVVVALWALSARSLARSLARFSVRRTDDAPLAF